MTSKVPLNIIEPIVRKLTRKVVATDDAAVAEYVRQQCDWLRGIGEFINDYDLVRETETSLTGMKVTYKLVRHNRNDPEPQ